MAYVRASGAPLRRGLLPLSSFFRKAKRSDFTISHQNQAPEAGSQSESARTDQKNDLGPAVSNIFKMVDVSRKYLTDDREVEALKGVNLEVRVGEVVVVMGPSGAGKSTLLQILGLLEKPCSGAVYWSGRDVSQLPANHRSKLRKTEVGFLFQDSGLIDMLSLEENIILPLMFQQLDAEKRRLKAAELLEKVGLSSHGSMKPGRLSGGERQRGGIARALATSPRLLICDEPTAALDAENAALVIALLRQLANEGCAVLISSHDNRVLDASDKCFDMRNGELSHRFGSAESSVDAAG